MAMLYSSDGDIRLQTTYEKALYISFAFEGTIAIVYMRNRVTYFAHFSKDGKLLFQKDIDSLSGSFGMISDWQFVFKSPKICSITVINLNDYSFNNIAHGATGLQLSDETYLQYFFETRLICVVQITSPKEERLRLTYYHLSQQQHTSALATYETEQKDWGFQILIKKGNNKSLMIWFEGNQSKYLQFQTFELIGKQGVIKHHKIQRNSESYPKNISVCDIWQATDHAILVLFSCQSQKNKQVITSFLIADLESNHLHQENAIIDDGILAASAYFGSFSIFTTYLRPHAHSQYLQKLIYFDNQAKKAITETITFNVDYKSYHHQKMIFYKINYLQSSYFKYKIVRIMRPKEIALHFMLHLNEDFDDDLLQDAIQLMDLQ